MGVEPFLLASSLLGVLAQRLVRVPGLQAAGEHEGKPRLPSVGCAACNQPAQRPLGHPRAVQRDDEARRLIHEGRDERELRIAATVAGMQHAGRRAALGG